MTMIDRYGEAKVRQMVSAFYGGVLRSPRLGPYFDGVSISGLVAHQAAFLAAVMGGPPSYDDAQLTFAHSHLGVDSDDFEEMLRLLEGTLKRFRVSPGDIREVMSSYQSRRPQIMGADASH